MGACLSRSPGPEFHTVRVVYLNGCVDEFDDPVSVASVIGQPGKHFVCTPAQLISGAKPMRAEAELQPGRVYLSLPFSALQADMSALDFAALAARLTALARAPPPDRLSKSPGRCSPLSAQHGGSSPSRVGDGARRSGRKRASWKPILDTIREKSFRNESELNLHESSLERV